MFLDSVAKLLVELSGKSSISNIPRSGTPDLAAIKEDLSLVFKEWFTAFCHPASSESLHSDFVLKVCLNGEA